ncbi:MAG: helix-turn-helix domain-containing protein [Candidatus Omnitrophica bacterium]|nr:helix-turn-helix domain-containing protein [Candidatus Omnitrophota bacterium]
MGVTHKLSPEVLNYILQLKQSNPALGCRKLAELVSAHFQTNVSKSSVNNVLKDANLSNSVGRPSKKAKEKMKKFQIPSDKKQQISQALQQIPIPENVQKQEAAEEDSSEMQVTVADLQHPAPDVEWGEVITMNNAGGMLLLAAFYENMDEALMGGLLNDYNSSPDRRLFEKKCNAALLMSSLDIIDSNERDILLREQASFEFKVIDLQDFMNIATTDIDRILLQTKIDLELSQLANTARGFAVSLDSGKVITMGPYLSIGGQGSAATNPAVPMKSAIDKLSEELLVNNQPLLFTRTESSDPADAVALMAAFSGVDGYKLNNISILGDGGLPQLEFTYITEKQRRFLYGIYKKDEDFSYYVKASQWAERSAYMDRQGKNWEYSVTRTDYVGAQAAGFPDDLRVVTVWSAGDTDPQLAMVTNSKDDHKLLLDRYLSYFVQGRSRVWHDIDSHIGTAEAGGEEFNCLGDVFRKFAQFLSGFVAREYLGGAGDPEIYSKVFTTPGSLLQGKAIAEICLRTDGLDDGLVEILNKCVEIVNMRKIYDRQHRLLRFILT